MSSTFFSEKQHAKILIFSLPLVSMDYSLQHPEIESYIVSFLPGETANKCQLIMINDDDVLETDEVFSMSLTTDSLVADLSPAMATVTIIDNDGGLHFLCNTRCQNLPSY